MRRMNPIAVFYHYRLSGGWPAISEPHAARIFAAQMEALGVSGLAEAASKIMAMAASVADTMAAAPFLPAKTMSIALGDAATELPTLCHLQVFAQNNPDWYIFYHHIKCATRSDNLCRVWRECMTRRLVLGWRHCVALLDSGCDSVGCHWLTPEQYPALVQSPFWGGNFWWAKASFIDTLPKLPLDGDRFLAEKWIGTGIRRPRVFDLHPAWPSMECAEQ